MNFSSERCKILNGFSLVIDVTVGYLQEDKKFAWRFAINKVNRNSLGDSQKTKSIASLLINEYLVVLDMKTIFNCVFLPNTYKYENAKIIRTLSLSQP